MKAGKSKLLKQVLALSVPATIANVSAPILSVSDMAIAGHSGSARLLAAVALGGVLFNLLYWLMGFLRMGTSGLAAQANGRGERDEVKAVLMRSLAMAVAFGLLMIAFREPLCRGLIAVSDAGSDVGGLTGRYFSVCVLGAPAMLGVYSFNGWYVGCKDSFTPMTVSLAMTAVNVVLSVAFVFGAGMGITGVALGTAVSQWIAFVAFVVLTIKKSGSFARVRWFVRGAFLKFFNVNVYIFLRTLCMVSVTFWFARCGAGQGSDVLAANSLLMQFFTFFSFFMDGLAYSAEGICGQLYAGGKMAEMYRAVRVILRTGAVMAVLFTTVYFVCGDALVELMSAEDGVNRVAHIYMGWVVAVPLVSFTAFVFDGVYVGMVKTREMFAGLLVSAGVFYGVYALCYGVMANHGLWLAFGAYLLARSVFYVFVYGMRKVFY